MMQDLMYNFNMQARPLHLSQMQFLRIFQKQLHVKYTAVVQASSRFTTVRFSCCSKGSTGHGFHLPIQQ